MKPRLLQPLLESVLPFSSGDAPRPPSPSFRPPLARLTYSGPAIWHRRWPWPPSRPRLRPRWPPPDCPPGERESRNTEGGREGWRGGVVFVVVARLGPFLPSSIVQSFLDLMTSAVGIFLSWPQLPALRLVSNITFTRFDCCRSTKSLPPPISNRLSDFVSAHSNLFRKSNARGCGSLASFHGGAWDIFGFVIARSSGKGQHIFYVWVVRHRSTRRRRRGRRGRRGEDWRGPLAGSLAAFEKPFRCR